MEINKFPLPWLLDKDEFCIRDADGDYLVADSDQELLQFIVDSANKNQGKNIMVEKSKL